MAEVVLLRFVATYPVPGHLKALTTPFLLASIKFIIDACIIYIMFLKVNRKYYRFLLNLRVVVTVA